MELWIEEWVGKLRRHEFIDVFLVSNFCVSIHNYKDVRMGKASLLELDGICPSSNFPENIFFEQIFEELL
jgi:hypothetical protein